MGRPRKLVRGTKIKKSHSSNSLHTIGVNRASKRKCNTISHRFFLHELCVLQENSRMHLQQPQSQWITQILSNCIEKKNAWLDLLSLTSTLSCIGASSQIRSLFVGPLFMEFLWKLSQHSQPSLQHSRPSLQLNAQPSVLTTLVAHILHC